MAKTIVRATVLAAALLLLGCASAADLKPGVPLGALEDGFEKTATYGRILTGVVRVTVMVPPG